ncbi:MAG: aminotransferase class I/II-fold pyridoxal phosphate-dependent enzyme [Alphaproteobacteria bacterium]|nr:aminotransferase class I/II-fold pyridoxal phosphate-dependent enzyme [Alphaproteobacteria bacterium]
MFYELAVSNWGEEEKAAIAAVVESDRFTMGPQVAAFEKAFASYLGCEYGVMVNSGSSANLVAVASLFFKQDNPLKPGDEVIVPALSWSTTYHPLQQYGLKLKFVDIELDTLNVDCSKLEAALSPRTKMIVAVSILGNPAALDVMRDFADANGLYFFEDNCESLDAELSGRKTGTFGDMGSHSFFFSHHIATMEGGMVVTDDEELCHLMRSLRAHGWTRDVPSGSKVFEPRDEDFFEAYRFILPGYNLRPVEMSGAIGLEQLKKLPAMTEMRRKNLALFQRLFGGDDRFIIQRENGRSSSFCFPIILNPTRNPDRARVFAALEDDDIGYRIITGGSFPKHDAIRHFDFEIVGAVENANTAHDFGFFVGNHPFDLTPQIERVYEVLDKTCDGASA